MDSIDVNTQPVYSVQLTDVKEVVSKISSLDNFLVMNRFPHSAGLIVSFR